VPLKLIYGPPNSGRRGLVRRRFVAALDRAPILALPTLDDVFSFERELCEGGAALGGEAMTFGALFRTVASAGGSPPGAELSAAQRLRAVSVAVERRLGRLGPLRRSAERPGFARAFERLLSELQAAGVGPGDVEAGAATLEGSAYLGDLAALFAGYVGVREETGRADSHGIAREAIALLHRDGSVWDGRPVFLYGFDDLTPNQLDLIEELAGVAEVTVALTYEPGNSALAARARLLNMLRQRIGSAEETMTEAEPANTEAPLLFHLARSFGTQGADPRPPGEGLRILRSAGARGEAEAIAAEVSRLIFGGADPAGIAIALRDPARRGPAVAATLEANGVAFALEAELPVAGTAVGGALAALLRAEFGERRAADLLRYLRGPSGFSLRRVDWFERSLRRGRVEDAETALLLWQGEESDPPRDLTRLREAAARSAPALAAETARLAATMAARPLRGDRDAPTLGPGDGIELRAAAAISSALGELAELGRMAPAPGELAAIVADLRFRVWSGPVEGRVRIADPYRLRAGRFDHVFVGSLQDGEFPSHDRGDPFLSEAQRTSLGLESRRDAEAEERYLFAACLSLPRRSLVLSYRYSDEDGAAEARSPLLDDVRALLPPAPGGGALDPVEKAIAGGRELAEVVPLLAEAASEDELARALAAHGPRADAGALLSAVGVEDEVEARIGVRIERACRAEAASRAPGPLANPAAIDSLAGVAAYGGTTLEEFDLCSYRWFVGHELDPQPLGPAPDPLVQGGVMHAVLDRLYGERPGGEPLPRPGSLAAWAARGRELVAEVAAERELGAHPAERAMARRVERLLERFLAEEAEREAGGFEPWLLEATFGEREADSERPALDLGGWGLHGAIDRVDRAPDGRAVVLDYKLASAVTPREKFEERAKLQLPLYLIAVAENWGAKPVAGLYHPLRGTSVRRPRGVVLEDAAGDLAGYDLYENDVVGAEGLAELLEDSRRRAGEIVARIRRGDIRRDPGPRPGLRGHDICPLFCEFAPICRRDRAPRPAEEEEAEER
jgi:ATP-dependent helicase/DNAse subunit B